jgi:hypothetical protein
MVNSLLLGRYKDGFAFGLGMVNIEIAILATLIVVNIIWSGLLTRITLKSLHGGVNYLDTQLAAALTQLVEETIKIIPGDIEPPNPLVAVFADYLKNQIRMPEGAEKLDALTRDAAGKFQSDNL